MKRASTVAAALVLAFSAAAADAQEEESGGPGFVGSVTLTTEYILRGISQTDEDPAIQGNIDFVAGGFYAGVWASNVEVSEIGLGIETHSEFDLYAGYLWQGESGFGWELGAIHYEYPSHEVINYEEFYASFLYKTFKIRYYYTDDFLGLEGAGSYLDGTAKIPFGDSGFAMTLHAGLSAFDEEVPIEDYIDYKGGLSYTWKKLTVDASYTDTDENQFGDLDDGRVVGSLSLTL